MNYNMKKAFLLYLGIALFCLVFSIIYDYFSHGVESFYMKFLALFPLILGGIPSFFFWVTKLWQPKALAVNVYNAGVASVTVSSMLRGIFEIAGTGSKYQPILMYLGIGFLVVGFFCYIVLDVKRNL